MDLYPGSALAGFMVSGENVAFPARIIATAVVSLALADRLRDHLTDVVPPSGDAGSVQLPCFVERNFDVPQHGAPHGVWLESRAPLSARLWDSLRHHVPDIGRVLPVYVADEYEGFEVKTFPELSEEELAKWM